MKKQITDIKLKQEIVLKAIEIGVSKVSRDYYISRVTITKWVKRYKEFGLKGLEDIKKKKSIHPNEMSEIDIKKILDTKVKHIDWSARKIKDHLKLDYSLQTVSKKIKTFIEKDLIINDEVENKKSLSHLELKTVSLSSNKNNYPTHQFELIDLKSGLVFIGFSCERSNLSLSIFVDYVFRNLKDCNIDLKRITLYTKKTRSSYSFSDKKSSLFEFVVKEKYGINLSYNINTIHGKNRKRKIPKFENLTSEKEYLFQGFSYIIYNNNFSSSSISAPIEQIQKDYNCDNANKFNLPPIIVDNHLDNLSNIESLEDYWYITEKEKKLFLDKTISYYKKNADRLINFNYNEALNQYKTVENLLKSDGDNEVLLNSIEKRANLLVQTGKWKEAEALFSEALEIAMKIGDDKYLARLYRFIAQRFLHKGDFEIALSYIKKSYLLSSKSKYYSFIPEVNITTGLIYSEMDREDEAMSYYKKVITYSKKHGSDYFKTVATINIALIYLRNEKLEKATDLFLSIIEDAKKLGNTNYLAAIYGNLGSVFSRLQEYSKSMNYNLKTLRLIRKSSNKQYIAILFGNFANIYQHLGNFDRAQRLYKKELDIVVELGDQKNMANVLYNIGHCYLNSSDLKKSLENLKKSSKIYKKLGKNSELFTNLLTMANIYEEKNDFTKVKRYIKEAEEIEIDNLSFENRFNLNNIKTQVDIDKIILKRDNPKKIIKCFLKFDGFLEELNKSKLNSRYILSKKSEVYLNLFNYLQKINKKYSSDHKEIIKLNMKYKIKFYGKKLLSIYERLNRNSENYILNERVKMIEEFLKQT